MARGHAASTTSVLIVYTSGKAPSPSHFGALSILAAPRKLATVSGGIEDGKQICLI
jgi:hypothetical protein